MNGDKTTALQLEPRTASFQPPREGWFPGLMKSRELNLLRFGSFFRGHYLKRYVIAGIEHLKPLTDNRCVVHKHVLPRVLRNEPKTTFIVPPFHFATRHNLS